MEGSPEPIVVTLIHGTWGHKASFLNPDSALQTVVRDQFPGVHFELFKWSGSNSHHARTSQPTRSEIIRHLNSPVSSPVSTEATVSDGIVSGIRDWPEHQMKVFQITALISPGSSGGALVNANGEVIGVTFAQLVGGQNLNFAIPIGYLQSLSTDGPVKSLATINAAAPDDHVKGEESSPTGSYTGLWQSSKFSVSGAAQMTIRIAGDTARAEIFLTGGEVRSANLDGTAHRTGENIWTIELSSKKPKLFVRGIFRGNSFVGDYTYSRFLMLDQGRWILKKDAKPAAFLPSPEDLKTSAFWIDGLGQDEIWRIGDDVAGKPRRLTSVARADLESESLSDLKLHIEPDPTPHPRHIDICGWPTAKDEQEAIALELCHHSTLKVR